MRRNSILLSLVLLAAASARLVGAEAGDLRLIPFPKQLQLYDTRFKLDRPLVMEVPTLAAERFGAQVRAEFERAHLPAPEVRPIETNAVTFRIFSGTYSCEEIPVIREAPTPEDYSLVIAPDAITAYGAGVEGLYYANQTLCQLIRANRRGNEIPCLAIRDWPALRWRCFQDDMTRGPSSKPETLDMEVALGAFLKMNLFTYYMEYQYAFEKHPLIGPPDGSLTPATLRDLVAHAKNHHVDILGSQQSFGHFDRILSLEPYAALRENASILSPVNEGSYRLLDDMYSEVCPLLPLPFFNVCCDETFGLGEGPSKELADKIGAGGVYVQHIRRIHDLLRDRYKKRMMMWGDIILQHPDKLDQIPKDTMMLTWGYGDRNSFEDQIIPFQKSGYEFFVCPGTSNWSRILPDFQVATTNIRNFVRDGIKLGAIGMLNTTWEDDGESHNAVNWHAYAWGAECAWTGSTTDPGAFNRRIGAVLFGEPGDHFGSAIELLAKTHTLPGMLGMNNRRFWQDDFPPLTVKPDVARESAERLLAIVRPAIEHLEACRKEAVANGELLDAFLFGARRMEWIGARTLDGLQAAQDYDRAYARQQLDGDSPESRKYLAEARVLVEKNRRIQREFAGQFREIWLRESKPYALDWTMLRYEAADKKYATLLARLDDAERRLNSRERLAEPQETGLALPEILSRRARATSSVAAALEPDRPWLDASAKRRVGLVVSTGETARRELPIELDLNLGSLETNHARAFLLADGKDPQEILAQLDPTSEPGQQRLALLIPGLLDAKSEVRIHAYLGTAQSAALPTAAVTRENDKESVWMENDQVRLLLGAEGGHLYRWEVKSLGNRDMTMPGETNWSGFADVPWEHRNTNNALKCLAHGPALVRYECRDTSGLRKTISLFGGVSWVEVELNNPVEAYWDFDDPANFAADGPAPGRYLFSNGASGAVGRQADGVPAQVKVPDTYWGLKFNDTTVLASITPEAPTLHCIAPGAGAGGVGIESSPPASHFITLAGKNPGDPGAVVEQLRQSLAFRAQPKVALHGVQQRSNP
jgi:hypothetical protein